MRRKPVKPANPKTLFPNLNVHDFARFERCALLNSQERVRLTQAEECMRFLAANWREISVLEFSAKIMRPVAIVREIDR